MIFYVVYHKTLGLYVGKNTPTYAFCGTDQWCEVVGPPNGREPWWVDKKYAKVWTDAPSLKRTAIMGRKYRSSHDATFTHFEVHGSDGSVVPLDTFLK